MVFSFLQVKHWRLSVLLGLVSVPDSLWELWRKGVTCISMVDGPATFSKRGSKGLESIREKPLNATCVQYV